jgi:hypothetical protein
LNVDPPKVSTSAVTLKAVMAVNTPLPSAWPPVVCVYWRRPAISGLTSV